MIFGNRIPKTYFITSGVGESDITLHAGSYHLALREAGIEMANIITYSSILPKGSYQVTKPASIFHGEVMETITAVASCQYGEQATAGLIFARLTDNSGNDFGGLVCEYNGPLPENEVLNHLEEMLQELYTNGYDHLELGEHIVLTRAVTPIKMYGTALVALCFTSYDYPELEA